GALLRTGVPLSRNGVHRRGPRQAMRDDGGLQGDDRGAGRRRLADARCDGEAAYGQHLTWVYFSLPCGRSRIGTGARLRTVWRKPWGFESLRPHADQVLCQGGLPSIDREPPGRPGCINEMRTGRILSVALAGPLVLGACIGAFDREQSEARPSPSTAASDAPGPTGGDRSSLYGRIAFDNHDDVWAIDADGTHLARLTHSPGPDFDPSWSHDGTQIAFRSERSGETEIWVMNADGRGQRRMAACLSPAWSPDGSVIGFAGPAGLSVIRPDGTGLRVLPHTEGGEYPSWSPDGSRIAFNSNLTGDHVMYIAQADG